MGRCLARPLMDAVDIAAQADGGSFKPDYKAVREAIADVMEKDEDYDDGEHGRAWKTNQSLAASAFKLHQQAVSLWQLSEATGLQRARPGVAAQQLTATRSFVSEKHESVA